MTEDFPPGVVIVAFGRLRYTVCDPPRTRAGKLRLRRQSGTILTTWWTWEFLPRGYKIDRVSLLEALARREAS